MSKKTGSSLKNPPNKNRTASPCPAIPEVTIKKKKPLTASRRAAETKRRDIPEPHSNRAVVTAPNLQRQSKEETGWFLSIVNKPAQGLTSEGV